MKSNEIAALICFALGALNVYVFVAFGHSFISAAAAAWCFGLAYVNGFLLGN